MWCLGVPPIPVVSRIVQALQHQRSSDSEQPRVAPLNPSSDPSSSGQPRLETIVTSISAPSPPLNLYHIEAVRDNKPVRFVVDLVTKRPQSGTHPRILARAVIGPPRFK